MKVGKSVRDVAWPTGWYMYNCRSDLDKSIYMFDHDTSTAYLAGDDVIRMYEKSNSPVWIVVDNKKASK